MSVICVGLHRYFKVLKSFSKSSECRISWKILGGARVVAQRRADTCSHNKSNRRMSVNFRHRGPENKSVTNIVFTSYFYEGTACNNRCALFVWALSSTMAVVCSVWYLSMKGSVFSSRNFGGGMGGGSEHFSIQF
jgi:hypothetical protein